ncbi:hypothetical protein [Facilibium subflavum]|uniref:hypothetical protein n=1 Tax=Facilibium subflavum TaxID=2219058 RepID=UPI000E64A2A2|nr:hypothetical protein [Facilibium subflavum]
MKNRLLLLVIVVIVVVSAFYLITKSTETTKPATDTAVLQKFTPALQKVNYIEQGSANAPHKFYAIIDPNCKFCHALFDASQQAIENGQLAVRWVVVGIIKPSSPTKAIAILNADDPILALKQNESNFNYETDEGGITPINDPSDQQIEKLNQNIMALKGLINAVPAIIYINHQGKIALSGGAYLPLAPKDSALANNQKKLANLIEKTSNKWTQ